MVTKRKTQRTRRSSDSRRPENRKGYMDVKNENGHEEKDLDPITLEKAKKRFKDIAKGKERDMSSTASVVAPADARTKEDVKLQHRWYANPASMDFEGVDTTESPGFSLPSGERLGEDEYPKVVRWKQGNMEYTLNLQDGTSTRKNLKGREKHRRVRSPQRTLQVLATTKEKPKKKDFRVGFVRLSLDDKGLFFNVDQSLARGKKDPFKDALFKNGNNPLG